METSEACPGGFSQGLPALWLGLAPPSAGAPGEPAASREHGDAAAGPLGEAAPGPGSPSTAIRVPAKGRLGWAEARRTLGAGVLRPRGVPEEAIPFQALGYCAFRVEKRGVETWLVEAPWCWAAVGAWRSPGPAHLGPGAPPQASEYAWRGPVSQAHARHPSERCPQPLPRGDGVGEAGPPGPPLAQGSRSLPPRCPRHAAHSGALRGSERPRIWTVRAPPFCRKSSRLRQLVGCSRRVPHPRLGSHSQGPSELESDPAGSRASSQRRGQGRPRSPVGSQSLSCEGRKLAPGGSWVEGSS